MNSLINRRIAKAAGSLFCLPKILVASQEGQCSMEVLVNAVFYLLATMGELTSRFVKNTSNIRISFMLLSAETNPIKDV